MNFVYQWSSSQGLNINPNNLSTLYIGPEILQGGQVNGQKRYIFSIGISKPIYL